jgi:hypothetical protein
MRRGARGVSLHRSAGQAQSREHKQFREIISRITLRRPTVRAQKPGTSGAPAVDRSKSKDQHQAEAEAKADSASEPGGFSNDPDDPTNPNEVRERHLKKIHP